MYTEPQKTNIKHIILAVVLLAGTFSLFSVSFGLDKEHENQSLSKKQEITTPQLRNNYSDPFSFKNSYEEIEPQYILQKLDRLGLIKARSFLVGDLDTGEVIFERKPHTQYPIASVTKYMTAFVAADNLEPNERTEITKEKLEVPGNRAGFKIGDTFTIRELMYPLLLVSSNDAGEIIAQQRNRDAFIAGMNETAEKYGMYDTAYQDPTGLSQNNVSTARDLFTLMRIVRNNYPEIVQISQLPYYQNGNYTWRNINKAATFPEFQGGKTGYTNAARQTSIGFYQIKLANDQIKNIGVIILQSDTREQDTRNILEYLKRYVAFL